MLFKNIKGQDSALAVLKKNIERNRIYSTYLFTGPDGVGKSIAACAFAKAINCPDRSDANPCGECNSCKKIDAKAHPDVFFIAPKSDSSSIAIAEIRKVLKQASLKPYCGKKKVFIVENTHFMNAEASNAFLKTLEEPQSDTVFILLSRSKDLLLPTIVSRCHVVRFVSAPLDLVREVIMHKLGIDEKEATLLASFASGRIGKAIRMKEENAVMRKNRIIDSLFSGRLDFQDELNQYSDKSGLKENLEFLLSFLRDMFLYKTVACRDVFFNLDRIEKIKKYSEKFSSEKLDYLIKKVITLVSYVDYNVNPKIIVDVLTSRVI